MVERRRRRLRSGQASRSIQLRESDADRREMRRGLRAMAPNKQHTDQSVKWHTGKCGKHDLEKMGIRLWKGPRAFSNQAVCGA